MRKIDTRVISVAFLIIKAAALFGERVVLFNEGGTSYGGVYPRENA